MGGIEFNSIEECCSENHRRVKSRKRAKVTGAEGVRQHPNSHEHRNPRGRPARTVRRVSGVKKSVSSEGSWTKNFCEMDRWFALQTEDESMEHNVDVPVHQIAEMGRVKEVKQPITRDQIP